MGKWALIAGIVMGLAAMLLVHRHISEVENASRETRKYVVLTRAVDAGTVLEKDWLESIELPARDKQAPTTLVPFDQVDAIVGREAPARNLEPGSVLTWNDLRGQFGDQLTMGKKAKSIPVDRVTSVGFLVRPGSRVDVLATASIDVPLPAADPVNAGSDSMTPLMPTGVVQRKLSTAYVLENVKVLATDSATTVAEYNRLRPGGYSTVTLEVTAAEAKKLEAVLVQGNGQFALTLRHSRDESRDDTPPTALHELLK